VSRDRILNFFDKKRVLVIKNAPLMGCCHCHFPHGKGENM
jgi:hypothetical protein